MIVLALVIAALVLGIVELVRTKAQSLLAWGLTLLALSLSYAHLPGVSP